MMRLFIGLAVFFTVAFFISCGTSGHVTSNEKAVLDAWVGLSRAELIKIHGRPTSETPDGQGGEIMTYDTSIVYPKTSGTLYNNGNRGINNGSADNYVVTKSRIFYINPQAIIYRWAAKERDGY
jgi:hypothetical protein